MKKKSISVKNYWKLFIAFFILIAIIILSFIIYVGRYNDRVKNILAEKSYEKISCYFKPIFVGADIISKDQFLIDWLDKEEDRGELNSFLQDRAKLLGIEAIDLASDRSLICYQSAGTQVKMDKKSDTDIWYFDLIESGKDYNTELFYDSTTGILYMYYNKIIRDSDGTLLGVLGFLMTYSDMAVLLSAYSDYGITGYLVNSNGEIYLHPEQVKIGDVNIYDYYGLLQESESSDKNYGFIPENNEHVYKIDKLDGYFIVDIK